MSSIDRADPVILGHVLAQHRELHGLITAVRAGLESAAENPSDPRQRATFRDSLAALRDYLRGHFQQEERGGFIEESLSRMPRLAAAAREVVAEHPVLLQELDRLIDGLPMTDSSRLRWRDVEAAFDQFCRHLLSHERNENAVVQEGYNEDLGLGD